MQYTDPTTTTAYFIQVTVNGETETFSARTERGIWTDVFAVTRMGDLMRSDDISYLLVADTRDLGDMLAKEPVRDDDIIWKHTGQLATGSARSVYFARI